MELPDPSGAGWSAAVSGRSAAVSDFHVRSRHRFQHGHESQCQLNGKATINRSLIIYLFNYFFIIIHHLIVILAV